MTDIAEKLRNYANDDHERLCQGRTYSCSCGYDDKRDPLMTEAADHIIALRAEVERLRGFETANRLNAAQVKAQRAEVERLQQDHEHARKSLEAETASLKKYRAHLEAEVERLRAALQAWDDAVVVNLVMEGPRFNGVRWNKAATAWELTRAALEGK